jgi:cell wall-associated NlpC family hydrolase
MTISAVADVQSRISMIQSRFAAAASAPIATAPLNSGSAPTSTAGGGQGSDFATALAAAGQRQPTAATATAVSGASPVARSGGTSGTDVVAAARKYLGVPYVWGGTDPAKGLDCSGLVQQVYGDLGIDLPRVSKDQAREGTRVASMADARPGDLLAFDNSSGRAGIDHIAIYIGGGKMIEAPRPGKDVRITDVPGTPEAIRRILPQGGSPVAAPVPAASSRAVAGVPYGELFRAAAARHGVPAELLAAVAKTESSFKANAVSHAGAQGLMQLMPGTARELGVDPRDPAQAVDGAARLLKSHLETFGSTPLALAAYNAGPGAVRKYDGIPPYAETQAYVRKVQDAVKGFAL